MRLRTAVPMMLLLLLCACGAANTGAQTPIRLRTALNESGGCSFQLNLTADYGEYIRTFALACQGDVGGKTRLTVMEPELAHGITATVQGEDAQVSYEDTILAVEDFASRRISPMSAPFLLLRAWSEGYIQSTGMDGNLEQVHYLLGYGAQELEIVTWFADSLPLRAEVSDGTGVLISCEITDFNLDNKDDSNEPKTSEKDLGGD